MNFALGIEVNLIIPTGRGPFCEERAKRLQRKARPAGKRPKK